ncbi:hypothetical protein CL656_04395 [bacterium]|nr:hypothetical protein [bacterium]|tara:strand:- start:197 stop:1462 length:1266 start_codon:yes stop_codon:yes gene_type:complete
MASLSLNYLLRIGLIICWISQIISFVNEDYIEVTSLSLIFKAFRILPFFSIIYFYVYKGKLPYISWIYLFCAAGSALISYTLLISCCPNQFIGGFLFLISLSSLLIVSIKPSLLKIESFYNTFFLNIFKIFFYSNILIQIFQTFFSSKFSLPFNVFGQTFWIRTLGFFSLPSSTAIASLSMLCLFSHITIKTNNIISDNGRLRFTLLYVFPTFISILSAASGTAIIGFIIYLHLSRADLLYNKLPNIKQFRIFVYYPIINLLIIIIPILFSVYFALPYFSGRSDILTSLIGRFNIFYDLPESSNTLLPNLNNFGTYTNYFQSYGSSILVNISDSSLTSLYAQYGLIIFFVISLIFLTFFLKIYTSRWNYLTNKVNNNYILPTALSLLPAFITTNIFENYLCMISLILCLEPFLYNKVKDIP